MLDPERFVASLRAMTSDQLHHGGELIEVGQRDVTGKNMR